MENMKFKKLLLVCLSLLGSSFFTVSSSTQRYFEEKLDLEPKPIADLVEPIDHLIEAMIMVESGGNDSAVGDTHLGEPSIGVLQIRPIMVREVNRLLKKMGSDEKYKLKDRFNRDKSIEMFKVWYTYYHEDSEFEAIARSWNGGPKGPHNSRTIHYWNKVQSQLE